jgi:predicted nucleotide-binding protein
MNKMENNDCLLNEIDLLIIDIERSIEQKNSIELDILKRKAIIISEDALGSANIYLRELNELNFLRTNYSSFNLVYNTCMSDFIMESGKLKNIIKEIRYKIQRNTYSLNSKMNNSEIKGQNEILIKKPSKACEMTIEKEKSVLENTRITSKKIFVVHGHDEAMKQTIARFLENLELKPIILHEQPGGSKTLIEKFEDYSDVSFAIVLFSPDDMIPTKNKSNEQIYRARQNVIFELGYFIGKLNRKQVVSLCRNHDELDLPSDYQGIIYLEFDNKGGWKTDLFKELKAIYHDIDANKII